MPRRLLLLVFASASLVLVDSPTRAECPLEFSHEWGSYGMGPDQFQYVYGMARTPDGAILATDYRNHRIKKYDADGNLLLTFGSRGDLPGQFRLPIAVATDGAGNIFVTDFATRRLQKFDANGNFLTLWQVAYADPGFPSYLYTLTTDPAGNVFVPDHVNEVLYKYGPEGDVLATWTSDDPSWHVGNITSDENGVLYGTWGGFYRKFDSALVPLSGLTATASQGQLSVRRGRHYYAGYDPDLGGAARIFDESGTLLCTVGEIGVGAGLLQDPRQALPLDDVRLVLNDITGSKLVRFDAFAVPAAAATWGRVKAVYR
jgi:DNA-binding beta-propeller fold protein YncE